MRYLKAAILGISVLFLTVPSHAGSLVMYGIVDTGVSVGSVRRAASPTSEALSASSVSMNAGVLVGGSRWGIKGTEALADQWQVGFVLERGVNSTDGQLEQGGLGFGRQATLSVERLDQFKLDLGLQMNLSSRYFLAFDPFHGGTSQLALGTSFGNANVIRYANLVQLQVTPIRALKLGLSYSFDAQLAADYGASGGSLLVQTPSSTGFGTTDKLRVLSAGMLYQDSGLTFAAGYDKAYAPAGTPTGLSYKGPSAWLAGAKYDFKLFAVSAIVGQSFDGAFDGQLPGPAWANSGLASTTPNAAIRFQDGYDSASIFLGISVPVKGNWTLSGSWQAMQPRGALAASPDTATQQVLSLSVLNQLSRRLTVYAYLSGATNYAMVKTAKSQVLGAGMAYTF
jgi:general bacterial porin, GBP family